VKSYPGSHDVYYRGFREGQRDLGSLGDRVFGRGGFHIWPRGIEEGDVEVAARSAGAAGRGDWSHRGTTGSRCSRTDPNLPALRLELRLRSKVFFLLRHRGEEIHCPRRCAGIKPGMHYVIAGLIGAVGGISSGLFGVGGGL